MQTNLLALAQRPAPLRMGCFILALLLLWLPLATPIYLLVKDTNLASIATLVILYIEFILLLKVWGLVVKQQPHVFSYYGLKFTRLNGVDLLNGLILGLSSVVILFCLEGWLGWLVWQNPPANFSKIVLESLAVGLAIGLAEELLFRGWLLTELQQDYSFNLATWVDAVIFAGAHFIKPLEAIKHTLPQFPALLFLGLTQVWGKQWRRGRLGLPIGLHSGLVCCYYIVNVGNLVNYTGKIPDWVTGVNKNPLQGVMGILFMGGLALWMGRNSSKTPVSDKIS